MLNMKMVERMFDILIYFGSILYWLLSKSEFFYEDSVN